MTKDEILEIIKEHQDSYPQIIKAHHKEFYYKIISEYIGKKFGEKLYRWFNDDNESLGKCELCKNETKFKSFISGFTKFCSKKCSNISTANVRSISLTHNVPNSKYWIEKECLFCKNKFWSLIKRNGKFCSNKCSTKFTATDSERLLKIRKTKLKKYGNETFVNPEKAKQTCLDRYGVENVSKSSEIIEKIKKINREKYGVDWMWQNDGVKEKIKKIWLEKYGVENPSSCNIIKEKRKNTFIERYGVDNPFQSGNIKEKIKLKYKEKYGLEYPTQILEIKNKIKEINRKNNYKFLCESSKYLNRIDILFTEDDYINSSSNFKYKIKCKKCGNVFEDHFDGNGHPRCLVCYPNIFGFSYAEKEIHDFIKEILLSENIITKDRTLLKNRELDIYIPLKRFAIEYNGLFWHSENGGNKSRKYHLDKLERCLQKETKLITIFEDEWINNKDIIKKRLKHILNLDNNKIYARNCEIGEIDTKTADNFIFRNHLQGLENSASIKLGLYYKMNLIGVMTFGKRRISLGYKNILENKNEYELYRFSLSESVIGGASKLLSYFIKNYRPVKIISYADRRWSMGNLYEKIGFDFIGYTNPNYWYFKPGYVVRYHRFGFRKSILKNKLEMFDPNLTEWENMQLNGYDRIWDCGNLKYELTPKY